MATNPLRKAVATKYAGTAAASAPTAESSITPRKAVVQKYSAPEPVPASIVDRSALRASRNINPAPPTPEPAKRVTLRESMLDKYSKPAPGSQQFNENKKITEQNAEKNGSIASPEFFATKVSVRDEKGQYIKDFTGKENGEAKAAAEAYAAEHGGTVAVTPPAGFLGKMFVRAQDALKGALDNVVKTGNKFGHELNAANPDATPTSRIASGVDYGVANIGVLLSPLSAAFSAAEEVPVAGKVAEGFNYVFGKIGEGGGWAADHVVDSLPISDKAKADIKPAAHNLSALLAQLAAGKGGEVAFNKTATLRADIKTAITKDVIETNQLPRNVYVAPEKVKSIFQTGKEISAEELDLIKALGLDATGYRNAIKDGISIQIPAERIITIVDKPWFARAKEAFGIEPSSEKIVDMAGKPVRGPEMREERLLPPGQEKIVSGAKEPVKTPVEKAFSDPITPTLLDRISAFTPVESTAFGKKIVDTISEAVGKSLPADAAAQLPTNVDLIQTPSGDGRPAQFKEGRIEIFVPNLLEDLRDLAAGKEILAHEGEYATVYKRQPNESMEDLSVRYVRDIVLHEAGHQKTMTLEDLEKIRTLQRDINAAKLTQNNNKVIAARQELSSFMRTMEDKANAYVKLNREQLENEIFGGKRETSTEMQRRVNKSVDVSIPSRTPSKLTEKQTLIGKLKARARGAKEGFDAGKKIGADEVAKNMTAYYRDMITKMRDKQFDRLQKQSALVDYAKILPFRERGKFLAAIRNTITEKDFLDVLGRMQKASQSVERKVLITKIADELKGTIVKKKDGIPNAKFAIEAQRTLNEMRRLQKGMTYQQAQIEIANKISTWQTEHPDSAIPVELLREIEILKTVGIKDQTVAELSYTLEAITSLKENGRTKKEIEIFNRETDIQQKKDTIYDVITGGKPLPSEKLSIKTREPRGGVLQATKEFLTSQQYGFEEVLDVLSMMDTSSKPYESYLSRYANDKANDAFNTQNKGELTEIDGISTKMKEIYKLEGNTEVMQTLGALKEVEDLGDFKHADGKTRSLELSRGEAMQYYMWMQDETLTPTFENTLNWTPEIKEAVVGMLTPADKAMADWLIGEFYPKYYESINKVYSKEYGVDLPFNSTYSPVHRAVDATIPENVLLAQESAKYATARNGSLKDRQNSQIDLKATDAFENVMRHITKMEHYKAWSESMFEFRRIFGDKQIRQAIVDIHGRGYMKVLDNFLNDFARDGVAREKVVAGVDKLRGNIAKSLLGLNIKVGIKQLTGIMSYGIELPTVDFVAGVADFWTDPLGHAKFLHENSDTLQERFGDGFERDIKFAIQKGYDKRLSKANNLGELLFVPIRNADKFTVYIGSWATYRSVYNRAIKAGKSEAEAQKMGIREAENITNRVQESSRLDTLSTIQRGGSLAKLFTMFSGQPNKYLRIMMNAGRNYKAGRQSGATAMKRLVWTWFIVPFIYNLVADQMIDEKYRQTPGGLVARTLLGPLTYPLIVGQMFQSLYGWTQGERFAYQASPVEAFMNDAQKAIEGFKAGDAVDATTYAIDFAAKPSGVPSTLLTRPIRKAGKDKKPAGESVAF